MQNLYIIEFHVGLLRYKKKKHKKFPLTPNPRCEIASSVFIILLFYIPSSNPNKYIRLIVLQFYFGFVFEIFRLRFQDNKQGNEG